MHSILKKTFGGLSKEYYFRQLFFGALISIAYGLLVYNLSQGHKSGSSWLLPFLFVWFTLSALLYPYSRFVYESIVDFVIGGNWFLLPAVLMLFVKLLTMLICWGGAIFIAPIGLLYLYFYHSKNGG